MPGLQRSSFAAAHFLVLPVTSERPAPCGMPLDFQGTLPPSGFLLRSNLGNFWQNLGNFCQIWVILAKIVSASEALQKVLGEFLSALKKPLEGGHPVP